MESHLFTIDLALLLVVAAAYHLTPRLARPNVFFSVRVSEAYLASNDAAHVLARFRWVNLGGFAVGSAIVLVMASVHAHLGMPIAFVAQAIIVGIGFAKANRSAFENALPDASQIRQATLTPVQTGLWGGPAAWLGPFCLLGASALYLNGIWARLPERFPIHWDAAGQPNGWGTRTPVIVFGPQLLGAGIMALILLLALGLSRGAPRVTGTGTNASWSAMNRKMTAVILLLVMYFIGALTSTASVLPFVAASTRQSIFYALMLSAPLLVVSLLGVTAWFANQRRQMPSADDSGERAPESAWKWGLFYVNPDDPALLVEKRMGIGYTFNFARPAAWMITLLLLALPMVVVGAVLLMQVTRHR